VARDGDVYIFDFTAGGYTCGFEPAVYDEMLSTFRFIE
jgi:hypothetical protein